jgi:hypothetical protein
MGAVADILDAPEWQNKTPLEKANSRPELFALTLKEYPQIEEAMRTTDLAGRQKIYDDWSTSIKTQFPNAFTTKGYTFVKEEGTNAYPFLKEREATVPVADAETEQILAEVSPDNTEGRKRLNAFYESIKDDPAKVKPFRILMRSRYGNINDILKTDEVDEENLTVVDAPSGWEQTKEYLKQLAPTAVRVGGTVAGGLMGGAASSPSVLGTGPVGPLAGISAGSAGGALAVEPLAQNLEMQLGQRERYNVGQGLLNVTFAAINPVKMAPGAGLAMRLGTRATEGAVLSGGQNIINQALFTDKPYSLTELNDAIGFGAVAGAGFQGIGEIKTGIANLSSAVKARLMGQTPMQMTSSISEMLANTKMPEAEKVELRKLQSALETPRSPQQAQALSQQLDQEAKEAARVATTKQVMAEADEAAGRNLEGVIRNNQLSKPGEEMPLIDLQEQAARQIRELDAQKATAIKAQLSPQAQRMYDEFGGARMAVVSTLGSGGVGAVAGSTQGDTIEERVQNTALGFLAGAGVAAGTIKALSRKSPAEIKAYIRNEAAKTDSPTLAQTLAKVEARIVAAEMDAALSKAPSAVVAKYPDVFASTPRGQIPVEIQGVDGKVYPAVMNGYYELPDGFMASVGRKTDAGWSHGMLKEGEEIITAIPTGEEWAQGIREVSILPQSVPPPDAQITVMKMGGRTAVQVDIPSTSNSRPGFSGSVEDARAAGYDFNLPQNLDEGRYQYSELIPSNEKQINESIGTSSVQETGSTETFNGGKSEMAQNRQDDAGGEGPLTQGQTLGDQYANSVSRGAVDLQFARNVGAPLSGFVGGSLYGFSEGDTPQERIANAAKYGVMFGGAASVGARLAIPGRNLAAFAKETAKGTEGLPEWFLKTRDLEPLVRFRETLGNNPWARLKRDVGKVARTAGEVEENANAYLAASLYPGVVDAKVRIMAEQAGQAIQKNIDVSLTTLAKASGIPREQYINQLKNYMVAKTAKDYNRVHADFDRGPAAGMSDDEADNIIQNIKDRGIEPVFEDLRKQVREISDLALKVRVDTGLVGPDRAAALRKEFPEHIPLNREIPETEDSLGAVYGTPRFSSRSSGLKAGKGSELEVSDPLTSSLTNLKDAIIRGERNVVAQTVRNFYKKYPNAGVTVKRATAGELPENAIAVRYNESGVNKTDWVEFDDQLLANSLRNMGTGLKDPIMRAVGAGTNLLTQIYTRFSPSFFLANNPIRDRQEVFFNLAASDDLREAAKTSILQNPFRYMKAVHDAKLGEDTPLGKMYTEAELDGAFSGGYANATRKASEKALKSVSMDRSRLGDAGRAFVGVFDYLNDVTNDSNYLRVYDRAKKLGASRKEAAMLARKASIDFNLKSSTIKSLGTLYGFIGPAIQSTGIAAKNVIRSPQTIIEISGGFAGAALALDAWNSSMDPDWKLKKQTDFYRRIGIPVAIGKEEGKDGGVYYYNIPVAQSVRPIKGVMDTISDIGSGMSYSPDAAAKRMADVFADSMNPLGAGDITQALTPTLADPAMDVGRNVSFTGGTVYPRFSTTGLDIEKVKDRTLTTASGVGAVQAAKTLKEMTGYDVSPESILYLVRGYGGGLAAAALQAADAVGEMQKTEDQKKKQRGAATMPILASFIKFVPNDAPQISTESTDALDKSLQQQAFEEIERKKLRAENMATMRNTAVKPQDKLAIVTKRSQAYGLSELGIKDVVDGIKRQDNRTPVVAMQPVLNLKVENANRAEFIADQLFGKTREQQVKFLQSLPGDAMSKPVYEQVLAILAQKNQQASQAPTQPSQQASATQSQTKAPEPIKLEISMSGSQTKRKLKINRDNDGKITGVEEEE